MSVKIKDSDQVRGFDVWSITIVRRNIVRSFEVEDSSGRYRYEAVAELGDGSVKRVKLSVKRYLKPFNEFAEEVIIIERDDGVARLKICTAKPSGSTNCKTITLDEKALEKIRELLSPETYESIETPKDIEELIKRIRQLLEKYAV